jgi:Protein of unknown function (DUF2442)
VPKHLVTTTDLEIDAAIARGKVVDASEPHATAVKYHASDDAFILILSNGVEVLIPRRLLQGLERADVRKLRDVTIVGHGTGLHWTALNVDHYVRGLLNGVFGTRPWTEHLRAAGSVSSPAKAVAARENGRKGGRPKKKTLAAAHK